MESPKNQREVEDRLRDAMKMDRARIQIGRLSRFGLLEMSRQRLRPSLGESSHIVCPRCVGIGSIRSIESMALAVLRLIGEELRKDRTARVVAQVPVAVATYLINEKREWLRTLEDKSNAELIIVPNVHIQTPEYSIRRVRDDEMELPENKQASYLMPVAPAMVEPGSQDKKPVPEAPAVATLLPSTSAPIGTPPLAPAAPAAAAQPAPAAHGGGFWSRFRKMLAGEPQPAVPVAAPEASAPVRAPRRDEGQRQDRGRDRSRHSRGADGARRDRGDARRDGRDRNRDRDRDQRGDRDRNRDPSRRNERSAERGGERGGERSGAARDPHPREAAPRDSTLREQAPRDMSAREDMAVPDPNAPPGAPPASGEVRHERGERGGRGRRGRRRGRRGGGGGGSRESAGGTPGSQSGVEDSQSGAEDSQSPAPEAGGSNGSHDAPAAAPPREYHAEPREAGPAHEPAPLAHFEPTPRPEGPAENKQPYVVWSSAPAEKPAGSRGPEE